MRSDADHPFFKPLWRRIAITAICAIWAGLEWYGGDQMWTLIASGMTLYAVWLFLLPKRGGKTDKTPKGQE